MEYWLLFWGSALPGRDEAEIAEQLRNGKVEDVLSCPGLADFRRDLLASDPDWTTMRVLPGPRQPTDRYLALVFSEPPGAEELRDLRYVAARNRLTMYDPQADGARSLAEVVQTGAGPVDDVAESAAAGDQEQED